MKPYTFEDSLTTALHDPQFRAIWEANVAKREVTKAIIGERIKRKLTQKQLAHQAGLKQPSLARVESTGIASTTTLGKLAKAFGKRLEIRFV